MMIMYPVPAGAPDIWYQRPDEQTRCVILSDPLRQRSGSLRMTGQGVGPLV